MLERVWRKGKSLTLLVGMQTSTAIMENSVKIPLKSGNRTVLWSSNPTTGHNHPGNQIERYRCTPRFTEPLFIIARRWKQPRYSSADEWIRKLWYIYTIDYYSAIKKNTFESVLMKWMKLEPILQWSKPERKTPIQYTTHIYEIKEDGNNNHVCETAKETQMYRTVFWTLWEREKVGWFGRMALKHEHYHMWNESPVQVWCMTGCLGLVHWDDPEGWNRDGGGRGVQDEKHVYTCDGFMSMYGKPIQYCKVISLQLK